MEQWTIPGWLAVLALAALLALALGCLTGLLAVRRTRREQRAELAGLREELQRVAAQVAPAPTAVAHRPPETAHLITRVGEAAAAPAKHLAPPAPVLPPAQFADQVLRESVVTAASLLHGVRRALSPRSVDLIRGEMRREVKRSRKQRRTDQRIARREFEARQRALLGDESAA